MQYGIDKRKKRWLDFMNFGKPAGHMFQINIDNGIQRPIPSHENIQKRIDWALVTYERILERMNWLMDDRIPCLHVYTGTEIFAEAFGCKVHRPDDNMPFALPMINSAAEVSKIKVPELSRSTLSEIFDIADCLREKAGTEAIFQLPDIQSPLDIAALIWEKTDFYIALLEESDAVEDLMNKIKTLLVDFLDSWFERYGNEYIAHYPYYYMKGGLTVSEDEAGVINKDMFNRFTLPHLIDLSNHYGGIGIHCCANAMHQWDNFLKIPKLKLLNLVQPPEILKKAYKYFSNHTCQMHAWCGDGESSVWPENYPEGSRVVIEAAAHDKGEAIMLAEKLWKSCSREY